MGKPLLILKKFKNFAQFKRQLLLKGFELLIISSLLPYYAFPGALFLDRLSPQSRHSYVVITLSSSLKAKLAPRYGWA